MMFVGEITDRLLKGIGISNVQLVNMDTIGRLRTDSFQVIREQVCQSNRPPTVYQCFGGCSSYAGGGSGNKGVHRISLMNYCAES